MYGESERRFTTDIQEKCVGYTIHVISGCNTASQVLLEKSNFSARSLKKTYDIARGLEPFLAAEYDEASIKTDGFDIIAGLNNMRGSKYEDVRPM